MFGRPGCGGFGLSQLGGICRAAAESWWQAGGTTGAVAAYQPKGAASYAASKINLANPGTYNATDGALYPGWDAENGWKKTASQQHLKTGLVVTELTWTFLVRFSDVVYESGRFPYPFGAKYVYVMPQTSGIYFEYAGTYSNASGGITSGIIGMAGKSAYKNGVKIGNIASFGTLSEYDLYMLVVNLGGYTSGGALLNVQAFVVFNRTLSASEVAEVTAAMAAL